MHPWNTVYARTIPRTLRETAEKIVAGHAQPSVTELADATAVVAPLLEEGELETILMPSLSPSYLLFRFVSTWVFFVTVPTVLAAILFRRGMIARAFGVDYVIRQGKPASRLRMLWRSAVFNTPMLLGFFGLVVSLQMEIVQQGKTLPLLAILLLVLGVTICSGLLPRRGLSDRLSGTYPVPR